MNNHWLVIKQLDRQLKEWQALGIKYGRPRAGWVKTIRSALSMSAAQLANHLGLTRSRITQLENAEIHDAVTLRTLKETANAMGCELVYAIVPKNNSTIESIIKTRADQIANEQVARVAHSMSLEAQSVDADFLKNQKEVLVKNFTEHLNKKFWASPEKSDYIQVKEHNALRKSLMKEKKNSLKEEKRKKLITNLKKNK